MNKNLILTFVIIIFGNFHMEASAEELQLQDVHQSIEELTGTKGTPNEEEQVFKVSFLRSDLDVKVAGAKITPPMGLTSWAAFKLMGNHAMVMGDLVLLENEVNPVMDVALENGLEVTALHNHFFWDSPKVMFMHIGGDGEIEALAGSVGKVFQKIRETIHKEPAASYLEVDPLKTTLNPEKIEEILGAKGTLKDGVFKKEPQWTIPERKHW